jgi:cob(I)alamin adenosyltransferase
MPRLTKIYTRTGDDGTTGLVGNARISKNHERVESIGTVDEVNAHIGLARSLVGTETIDAELSDIQHDLFDLGAELAMPGHDMLGEAHVSRVEHAIDMHNAALPTLREFILPAGSQAGAALHVSRAVCRRAERRLITLSGLESVNPVSIRYLNRLSDYLFVLARVVTRHMPGEGEVFWRKPERSAP